MRYGFTVKIARNSFLIVVNGHIFSVFKGSNTGRWQATYQQNIWRKTAEAVPNWSF